MIIRNASCDNEKVAINTDLVTDYFKTTINGHSVIQFDFSSMYENECRHEIWAFDNEHDRNEVFENIMHILDSQFV